MGQKRITIAIDGYSACGKSTLARALAEKLGYVFIDSGAMYRAVALYCLEHQFIDDKGLNQAALSENLPSIEIHFNAAGELFLNQQNVSEAIRQPAVAAIVSSVAAFKPVREKLVEMQRQMGLHGGIVMDGRDIGSVVFPNAELKLFVTANEKIRAQRRFTELQQKGIEQTLEEIQLNLSQRDLLDSTREESPLVQCSDALVLDNSDMSREAQLEWALEKVRLLVTD
ncbi:MAG: hypothetical protein RLZZ301_520 [Bacteroidota bacterium]|jgi:cytidylate kinase